MVTPEKALCGFLTLLAVASVCFLSVGFYQEFFADKPPITSAWLNVETDGRPDHYIVRYRRADAETWRTFDGPRFTRRVDYGTYVFRFQSYSRILGEVTVNVSEPFQTVFVPLELPTE